MSDLPKQLRIKAGMVSMGERIAWGSDSALMEQAADLIEQQQKRIAELVDALNHIAKVANSSRTQSRRDRWICLRANCAISSSDEWKTADLPKIIENSRGRELRLRAENQELAATVERLRNIAFPYISLIPEVADWFDDVPQQSLEEHDRQLLKCFAADMAIEFNERLITHGNAVIYAEEYANQHYPSVKDGE